MSQYKYATKTTEVMAKGVLRDVNMSPKSSIEIANFIKGKTTVVAKKMLQASIALDRPIPFKRFTNGPGHKRGMGSGRFAIKACKQFHALIENVEANAQNKGLGKTLIIQHIAVQRASEPWKYGRQSRRKTKRAHVEMVVVEKSKEEKAK
jgi:large subunit ribosomal protein L22